MAAPRLSFDANLLFYSAAREAGATVLLSEDLQDGRELGGVRIRNPFSQQWSFEALLS